MDISSTDREEQDEAEPDEFEFIDSTIIRSLPGGSWGTFMKFSEILASKFVVEAEFSSKQVEDSLRRLVQRKDPRIVFYMDSTAGCFPDDFGSYCYRRSDGLERKIPSA